LQRTNKPGKGRVNFEAIKEETGSSFIRHCNPTDVGRRSRFSDFFGEMLAGHRPASSHSYQQSLVPRRWVTERDAQRDTPFGSHTEPVMESRGSPIRDWHER